MDAELENPFRVGDLVEYMEKSKRNIGGYLIARGAWYTVSDVSLDKSRVALKEEPGLLFLAKDFRLVCPVDHVQPKPEGIALLEKSPKDPRADVLLEAVTCTLKDRNRTHGEPEDNFANIASLWNAYLRPFLSRDITAAEVGILMTLFKVGRTMSGAGMDHKDNFVDGIGYMATAWKCLQAKKHGEAN